MLRDTFNNHTAEITVSLHILLEESLFYIKAKQDYKHKEIILIYFEITTYI